DGKVVGTGSFEGTIKSGGHTLRVEAEGMRAYQSEVVVADDENRSIDVPLEKEYAPPTPEESGPGGEVGGAGGAGSKVDGDKPWTESVRLDLGLRLGWYVDLGVYGEYGAIDASKACGTDSHGPTPSQPLDLSVRSSFQSCSFAKAGLLLAIHFLPKLAVDP